MWGRNLNGPPAEGREGREKKLRARRARRAREKTEGANKARRREIFSEGANWRERREGARVRRREGREVYQTPFTMAEAGQNVNMHKTAYQDTA